MPAAAGSPSPWPPPCSPRPPAKSRRAELSARPPPPAWSPPSSTSSSSNPGSLRRARSHSAALAASAPSRRRRPQRPRPQPAAHRPQPARLAAWPAGAAALLPRAWHLGLRRPDRHRRLHATRPGGAARLARPPGVPQRRRLGSDDARPAGRPGRHVGRLPGTRPPRRVPGRHPVHRPLVCAGGRGRRGLRPLPGPGSGAVAVYGIAPGVMAIIAIAAVKLARLTNRRDPRLWAISLLVGAVTAITGAEIAVLFIAAGLVMIALDARPKLPRRPWHRRPAATGVPLPPTASTAALGLGTIAGGGTLLALALFFGKAGAFIFGSGLAIVPFLREGVVHQHHWLTERQFLDAVAMGLITPGPVVITAAFIGYLVKGLAGALVATEE